MKSDSQMSLMSVNFGGVHVHFFLFFFIVWMCSYVKVDAAKEPSEAIPTFHTKGHANPKLDA